MRIFFWCQGKEWVLKEMQKAEIRKWWINLASSKLRPLYDNRYHKRKINYEQDKGIVNYIIVRGLELRIYIEFLQIKNPRGSNGKMGEVYEKAIHSRENLSSTAMHEKLLNFTVLRENSIFFLNEKNHSEGKTKKEKEY